MKNRMSPTCKKQMYKSKGHALGAAVGASRKSGDALRVYRCKKCPSWHLTSKPLLSRV